MRLLHRGYLAVWIAVLVLLAAIPVAARAQNPGPAVVRMAPALVEVAEGGTADVAVEVVDVEELYAFDVTVTFDPRAVEVVDADPSLPGIQVAQGPFLDSGLAVINTADNAQGIVHFVMTQLNPSVAKSGTGSLIVIKLLGRQLGASSALAVVEPQLARRDGFMIPATGVSGRVDVIGGGGPTGTPLPTHGAGTPLAVATPEPTSLPATATPETLAPPTATPVAVLPTSAPAQPAATATALPSRTPGPVAAATAVPSHAPTTTATATTVPLLPSPQVVSPTVAIGPSPSSAVGAAGSLTPEPPVTSAAQAPGGAGENYPVGAAPSKGRVVPWLAAGTAMLTIGLVVLAVWLRRRRSASR